MLGRKRSANITILIAFSFLGIMTLCAFAIDFGILISSRSKLQKIVENTAIASVSEYRYNDNVNSENIFNKMRLLNSIMSAAAISDTELKEEADGTKKIKITARLAHPTYFLKMVGVDKIFLSANAHAQSEERRTSDLKYNTIIELSRTTINKVGDDFSINITGTGNGFFIFAGRKNQDGSYNWQDLGCKAQGDHTETLVGTGTYNLVCSNDKTFDLSQQCTNDTEINTISAIQIYKAQDGQCPIVQGASEAGTDGFSYTILNNVKLIHGDNF